MPCSEVTKRSALAKNSPVNNKVQDAYSIANISGPASIESNKYMSGRLVGSGEKNGQDFAATATVYGGGDSGGTKSKSIRAHIQPGAEVKLSKAELPEQGAACIRIEIIPMPPDHAGNICRVACIDGQCVMQVFELGPLKKLEQNNVNTITDLSDVIEDIITKNVALEDVDQNMDVVIPKDFANIQKDFVCLLQKADDLEQNALTSLRTYLDNKKENLFDWATYYSYVNMHNAKETLRRKYYHRYKKCLSENQMLVVYVIMRALSVFRMRQNVPGAHYQFRVVYHALNSLTKPLRQLYQMHLEPLKMNMDMYKRIVVNQPGLLAEEEKLQKAAEEENDVVYQEWQGSYQGIKVRCIEMLQNMQETVQGVFIGNDVSEVDADGDEPTNSQSLKADAARHTKIYAIEFPFIYRLALVDLLTNVDAKWPSTFGWRNMPNILRSFRLSKKSTA